MTQNQFFQKYANFAASAVKGSGISPILILSQAFLESGGAASSLSAKYNNFFGVKADENWHGKKILLLTKEQNKAGQVSQIKAYFRVYDNPAQSFTEQIRFLKSNPRYNKAGLFTYANDYNKQADTLQKAGYATDINYATKLKTLSNTFSKLVKPAEIGGGLAIIALILFGLIRS